LAGAWRNATLVRVPRGLWTLDAVKDIEAQREGRRVMLCGPPFDDLVSLETRGEEVPWVVASPARAREPAVLRRLAEGLGSSEAASGFMRAGAYEAAVRAWLDEAGNLAETLAIGAPDLYREYGWMAPAGIAWRIETSPERANLDDIVRTQGPLWERAAAQDGAKLSDWNPYASYWKQCRALLARQINDVAVRAADEGRLELADHLLGLADRVSPGNLSVKMNLERVGEKLGLGEEEMAERREYRERESWDDPGHRWGLGAYMGYVHEPETWMAAGMGWALSGAPTSEAGVRRKSPLEAAEDGRFAKWVDRAFLAAGREERGERSHRQEMMASPWKAEPLLELARIALKEKRVEAAEAYLLEAGDRGMKPPKIPFEWAMVDYVRLLCAGPGGKFPAGRAVAGLAMPGALRDARAWVAKDGTVRDPSDVFGELALHDVGDMRVWMTLLLLADGREPDTSRIEKTLKSQRVADPDLWLTLCSLHIERGEWEKARSELNRMLRTDLDRVPLWEMTMSIAGHFGEEHLAAAARNRLLRMRPYHYLAQDRIGEELRARGDLEGAVRAFEIGVLSKRDPALLEHLAKTLSDLDPEKNAGAALGLVDEAIKRDPERMGLRLTRASLWLKAGNGDEALKDVGYAMSHRAPGVGDYVLLAEICKARGDAAHARLALRRIEALGVQPKFAEQTRIFAVRDWLDEEETAAAGK
ncbi:MAG: hypothetical protein IK066_08580, partial [Kiritimatiellae bacterium]|nr:hypothetical protein [Kiritimatiellia bacterium]